MKFYEMSQEKRLAYLLELGLLTKEESELLLSQKVLPNTIADNMIENYIGQVATPLGIVPGLIVDGNEYTVPMATEEPSVIAAASFASKLIGKNGGFSTRVLNRQMIGQVVFEQVENPTEFLEWLEANQVALQKIASASYPSIEKRGGGVRGIHFEEIEEYVTIYLNVDTKDAMGANMLNTMLEGISAFVTDNCPKDNRLMAILSNYATDSLVEATGKVTKAQLTRGKLDGAEVARKIVAAADYAKHDVYRAVTHNKGVMNGIDAVVLATGNDTRAIASGIHAYAAKSGQYGPVTDWQLDANGDLIGKIILPLPVATAGGATSVLPTAILAKQMLGVESAEELARLIASIGLAQNLAAVRALVSEGIQKGHMSLQARSLAITAGATEREVAPVAAQLRKAETMNLETAQNILNEIRNQRG
jgi:degradative hydroxymethylglutaryl-CoA reductase